LKSASYFGPEVETISLIPQFLEEASSTVSASPTETPTSLHERIAVIETTALL